MAIRRQRAPRPGEIPNWLQLRRGRFTYAVEEGRSGSQLRVTPAPCCANSKRGGSAVVNTATGLWLCFACGKKGNWYGFTRAAGEPLANPYEETTPVDFSVYRSIRDRLRRRVAAGHHPGLLSYCLEGRGIYPPTLDAWRVSTCGPDALRWPLTAWDDETGKWMIANARIRRVLGDSDAPRDWFEVKGGPTGIAMGNHLLGIEPDAWKAKRPSWAEEWLAASAHSSTEEERAGEPKALTIPQTLKVRRVLIVEGQWDAMTAWQLGIPNVLSLPNGANAVDVGAMLRYVPDTAEVWIAPDMDAAGEKAAEAFFAQLGSGVKRLNMPAKDLNDWLRSNPELTAENVLASAANGKPTSVKSGYVNLTNARVQKPAEIVCKTPWPMLTKRLAGGFRAGQTSGLLAPSGEGKSTIANNIIAQAIKERVKTGVIQLEGLADEICTTLSKQLWGWINPDIEEQMESVYLPLLYMSELAGKSVTCDDTLAAAEQMMVDGCKLVVIDNWDYITPPDGSGSTLKAKTYAKFQELCKKHRAHGFVVWQPNKVNRGEMVNSGQQKGMSTALQDADVYMTLNKRGTTRRLEVEKARVPEVDGVSNIVILCYRLETGCLEESKSQADLKVGHEDDKIF